MNKNIMCVCVSRYTTNIGFYDVEFNNQDLISVVFKGSSNDKYSTMNDVADRIINFTKNMTIDLIIIDSRAYGISIVDILESDDKFKTPVYKAYINTCIMTESLIRMRNFINENKLHQQLPVEVDLSEFDISVSTSGKGNITATLNKSKHETIFINMLFVFGFVYNAFAEIFNINKRNIIEKNLEEVLNILVDDLYELSKRDIKEVERLTRLIDKVNYLRGQY